MGTPWGPWEQVHTEHMWQVRMSRARRGERNAACNIIQHVQFGAGSLMVWGGISLEGCTDLHVQANSTLTAVRYQDEILRANVRSVQWALALVPPGAGQCPSSCGQSVQADPGGRRHWCYWLALLFPWPKSTDCPGAQWCPDPGLGGDPPEHHHPTHQEHVQMLSDLNLLLRFFGMTLISALSGLMILVSIDRCYIILSLPKIVQCTPVKILKPESTSPSISGVALKGFIQTGQHHDSCWGPTPWTTVKNSLSVINLKIAF